MESFANDIQTILSELDGAERQADEMISSFQGRFDKVLQKFIIAKATPIKPTKKKPKGRIEKMDSLDDSFSSTNSGHSRTTVDSNATRTSQATNETIQTTEETLLRPVRTGRAKQPTSYKEPALNTKMRRDKETNEVVVKIKTERPSVVPGAEKPVTEKTVTEKPATAVEPKRITKIKKEKVDDTSSANSSPNEPSTSRAESKRNSQKSQKSVDDSLEIIPMDTSPPIELSDEDNNQNDVDKMPPPAFVPQTKPTKEKKAPAEKKTRSTRSKQTKRPIKQEPASESEDEAIVNVQPQISEETATVTSVPSDKEDAPKKRTTSRTTSRATSRTTSASESSSRSTAVVEKPVEKAVAIPVAVPTEKKSVPNASDESAYEDAEAEPVNPTASQQTDATFVTTADVSGNDQLSPRGTYVIPNQQNNAPNETFDVTKATKPSTSGKADATKVKASANDIMTDDESDSESIYQKKLKKLQKDPKELFNPCASNPIKQRVEAFEKLQTPQKETKSKSRLVTAEASADKPTRSNMTLQKTMSSNDLLSKHTRTNSATRQGTRTGMLTKSQSVEEINKKKLAAADDKKKKQDEKLRKAQQMREAQEKEKIEKQRKLLQEKEQRAKEKLLLKQQEEAQKAAEQKRKDAEREQKRKETQAKKAAAEKKEQEHYLRILAEKKAMQEMLRQNKLKAEEAKKKNPYNFDMLESGDSTDEETKTSNKKPPPPAWSLSQNRKPYILAQAKTSTKVIDKFFSVAPLEVDLREIFPKIDEKHLRRNSSAVWNSPPRYSMLPKY